MDDPSKTKSGGGCLAKLVSLILLAGTCALAAALFFISQPQTLNDVGGYGQAPLGADPRDLKTVLNSALERGYPVAITETEINQWLGKTLIAKQGGLLASQVSLKRVWVRLCDGHAEVIMERSIFGRPFTVSMFVKIEQIQGARGVRTEIHRHGGPYHENVSKPLRGGRFGKLVVPQGFLILVMPAYAKLADISYEEIRLALQEMARIRIEPDRLLLESREPSGDPSLLPQTF